jgi:TatA/E family protein of Tat protein translocase
VIVAVVLLLVGAKRLPRIGEALGRATKAFRLGREESR